MPWSPSRRWTAYGATADGARVFYYASEAAEPQSWTRPSERLEDVVRGFNREYQKASAFTELAPLNGGDYQRFVDPKDIAALALFVASDAGKSISGQLIPIDNDMQMAS